MRLFTVIIFLFFTCVLTNAQHPTYSRLTLSSHMDQFRFEIPGENRYWFMSKPSAGRAYVLYSPDDGGSFTSWQQGSGDMIMHKGNLGIGISNPSERLEVDGNIKASNLLIKRADITSSEIDNTRTIGLYRVNYSGHSRALLDISGFGGSTPRFQLMAHYADKLYYRAARDGAANWDGKGFREVILANEDGNVGIGTNNPQASFHIKRNEDFTLCLQRNNTIDGDQNLIKFITSTEDDVNSAYIGAERIVNGWGKADLVFGTNGNNEPRDPMTERMRITSSGNVGIGTTTPDAKLTVAGLIKAREIKVETNAGADFVFEDDYNLQSLDELDQYIKTNKHLPEIASEAEMKAEGVNVSEFQIQLLQKIEELTLYTIEQNKKIDAQNNDIKRLEQEVEALKDTLE